MVAEVTKTSSLIAAEWNGSQELGKDGKDKSCAVRLRERGAPVEVMLPFIHLLQAQSLGQMAGTHSSVPRPARVQLPIAFNMDLKR